MNQGETVWRVIHRVIENIDMSNLMDSADWRNLLGRSETVRKWATTREALQLFLSVQAIRPSLVGIMLAQGVITEEEAKPSNEGGLGLMPLIQRALEAKRERE